MQFLGLSLLFALSSAGDDSDEICERGALNEVTRCTVSGDPHFTMFNKMPHDMQGEDQYYYVKKCCDVDTDDMPFAIMGKHHFVTHRKAPVSTLDYITLELTDDDDDDVYYAHISRDIKCYYNADDAASKVNKTLYDYNVDVCQDLEAKNTYIGDLFKLRVVTRDSGVIAIVLTIDEEYKVTMRMTPSKNAKLMDGRMRGHSLVIDPFEEYKCYSCGLCGNFRNALSTFETCDGGSVTVVDGLDSTNPFAYDITGNTYSVNYCDSDATCVEEKEEYECSTGGKEIPEFCRAKMFKAAKKKCTKHIEDVWECCATLDDEGGCNLAIAECAQDACIEADVEDDLNVLVADALYEDATALCEGMIEEYIDDEDDEIAAVMVNGVFGPAVTPVVNYIIIAAAISVFILVLVFVYHKRSTDYKVLV